MACQKCGSARVLKFSGKCSDAFFATLGEHERDGYVPYDAGIGGGDYVRGNLCLDCGQMQGTWPCPQTELEQSSDEDDE